jgi:hypothetical protein
VVAESIVTPPSAAELEILTLVEDIGCVDAGS